ncbi:DUF2800 domain-containing protein [Ralstonia sp.]|uniref:DUF2800 domain-containing protein n=1 Tax=Ralstonia sp. TaxID=54061 RepID=UPI00257BD162|nr:DUF2800 domain-containing protein [Ralstonia sp.]
MSEGAAHSIAAPSALGRIAQCAASIKMQLPFPEQPDADSAQAAAEGTAAHWAMAEQMAGRLPMPGDRAANGIFLTEEMCEASDLIVEDVRQTIEPHGLKLSDCITEVPVSISRVHPLCWGTPDIRVWLPGKTLVVWDLKFGFRHVPVFENYQLIAYSVGCIEQAGLHDLEVQVVNRIVQPRSYHSGGSVREWRYRAADVRAHVNIMAMAVTEALGENPRAQVGPECRDCRARHACEALQRASYAAMDLAGSATPHELPPAALGVELRYATRALQLLEARKAGLEEQALALIRSGARVPHFSIENGAGRLAWAKPDAQVIALGQLLGKNLAKPPEAITPAQAESAGLPLAQLSGFVTRKPGAAKLVADDGSQARRVFGSGIPRA